ncbi:MAG: low temperature requirement protein A [Micromonosporaceae bacterium]|nr:low temperature requirement protein A [Micromonosporaceae bacterium]
MSPRRADEEHRAATPLELFFDLCFVVAVALAAGELHHALSEGHLAHALPWYLLMFFGVWWAWMNFTWFASAYDTDDGPYRLTTLVQIAGALVFAAGIKPAFEGGDLRVVVLGYVIMRLAMGTQWLRVARSDPERRACALRYAGGIAAAQVLWILRLWTPESWTAITIGALIIAELAVPVWAERAASTTWHPQHITERYGLFTIIVLGESILAASTAVQSAVSIGKGDLGLVSLAAAGLATVFAMWWLYFDQPVHHLLRSLPRAIFWGYGHYVIFAAAAAVGAGLQVAVDHKTGHSALGGVATGYAIAAPVAIYLLGLWALHVWPNAASRGRAVVVGYPVAAALVLLTPFSPAPIHLAALVLTALVAASAITTHPRQPANA